MVLNNVNNQNQYQKNFHSKPGIKLKFSNNRENLALDGEPPSKKLCEESNQVFGVSSDHDLNFKDCTFNNCTFNVNSK